MRAIQRLGLAACAVAVTAAAPWVGATDLTPAQAKAIAVEAYVYAYPLVTMDVTRRVMTNVPVGVKAGFDERANEVRTIQAGGVPGGSRPSIHRREGE